MKAPNRGRILFPTIQSAACAKGNCTAPPTDISRRLVHKERPEPPLRHWYKVFAQLAHPSRMVFPTTCSTFPPTQPGKTARNPRTGTRHTASVTEALQLKHRLRAKHRLRGLSRPRPKYSWSWSRQTTRLAWRAAHLQWRQEENEIRHVMVSPAFLPATRERLHLESIANHYNYRPRQPSSLRMEQMDGSCPAFGETRNAVMEADCTKRKKRHRCVLMRAVVHDDCR